MNPFRLKINPDRNLNINICIKIFSNNIFTIKNNINKISNNFFNQNQKQKQKQLQNKNKNLNNYLSKFSFFTNKDPNPYSNSEKNKEEKEEKEEKNEEEEKENIKSNKKNSYTKYSDEFKNPINFNIKEPEEFRTIYIENLPHDWDEEEITLRLEQIGQVKNLHIVKNTLGESLGKVIVTYDSIENSINAMNTFRNKIPFFNPLKIRFYRKYDFLLKKLIEQNKLEEENNKNKTKRLLIFEANKNEVLLLKNLPQHLKKEDLNLFISEFRTPVHISYPRDEYK
jgi:hypothetical protein